MTFKSVSLQVFTLIFSLFLMTSCAENKKETKEAAQEEAKKEMTLQHDYQCPMDCEKGKTYHETGSCPVCKMDLKEVEKGEGMTCKQHEDGKCTCEGDKCACANCAEHSKTMSMTCKQHEDGKCTCEGDKCACANCAEHS